MAILSDMRERGTTFVIVSHESSALRELTERCVWLQQGAVHRDGPTDTVLDEYMAGT